MTGYCRECQRPLHDDETNGLCIECDDRPMEADDYADFGSAGGLDDDCEAEPVRETRDPAAWVVLHFDERDKTGATVMTAKVTGPDAAYVRMRVASVHLVGGAHSPETIGRLTEIACDKALVALENDLRTEAAAVADALAAIHEMRQRRMGDSRQAVIEGLLVDVLGVAPPAKSESSEDIIGRARKRIAGMADDLRRLAAPSDAERESER